MNIEPIYRDYYCSLSQKNCALLLQSLAITGGSITSNFTLHRSFPEEKIGRWEMHFRLEFGNQESLDNFHALGLQTTKAERVWIAM